MKTNKVEYVFILCVLCMLCSCVRSNSSENADMKIFKNDLFASGSLYFSLFQHETRELRVVRLSLSNNKFYLIRNIILDKSMHVIEPQSLSSDGKFLIVSRYTPEVQIPTLYIFDLTTGIGKKYSLEGEPYGMAVMDKKEILIPLMGYDKKVSSIRAINIITGEELTLEMSLKYKNQHRYFGRLYMRDMNSTVLEFYYNGQAEDDGYYHYDLSNNTYCKVQLPDQNRDIYGRHVSSLNDPGSLYAICKSDNPRSYFLESKYQSYSGRVHQLFKDKLESEHFPFLTVSPCGKYCLLYYVYNNINYYYIYSIINNKKILILSSPCYCGKQPTEIKFLNWIK